MTSALRALVLDADGTLWDTRRAMEAAGTAGALAAWPDLSPEVAASVGVGFRTDRTRAFRRFVAGELDFETMRAVRLEAVAQDHDLPWHEAASPAFEAAYGPVFDESLHAYADALPLLAWAAEHGIVVRVLTNSSQAYTLAKVVSTGLTQLAEAVCSRDCLGIGKPEPEPFRHACEQLGVEPGEALYIGDEWTADVLGSTGAGMRAAWLVRGEGDPAGEVVPTAERLGWAAYRGVPVLSSLTEVAGIWDGAPRPVTSSLGSPSA